MKKQPLFYEETTDLCISQGLKLRERRVNLTGEKENMQILTSLV